jgi:hypothetical protein
VRNCVPKTIHLITRNFQQSICKILSLCGCVYTFQIFGPESTKYILLPGLDTCNYCYYCCYTSQVHPHCCFVPGHSPVSISEPNHSRDAIAVTTPGDVPRLRPPSTLDEPRTPSSTTPSAGAPQHSSQIIPRLLRHLSACQGLLLASRESGGSGRAAREAQSKMAEVADAAFRSGVASATQGDVHGAIMLLHIAREACPRTRTKALAKIDGLLLGLEQQQRQEPVPPTASYLPP